MAVVLESRVASELKARVRARWSGGAGGDPSGLTPAAVPAEATWQGLEAVVEAWCARRAVGLLAELADPLPPDAGSLATLEPSLETAADDICEALRDAALVETLRGGPSEAAADAGRRLWERLQGCVRRCAETFARTAQAAGLEVDDLVQAAWVHLFADEDQHDADPEVRRAGEARIRRYDPYFTAPDGQQHFPRLETFVDKVARRLFISATGRSRQPSARRRPGEVPGPAAGSPEHQRLIEQVLQRIENDPKLALLRSAASLRQCVQTQPPHVLQRALADRRELRKLARDADRKEVSLADFSEAIAMGIEHCRAAGVPERKLVAFRARWVQGLKFKEICQLPEVGRSVGWIHSAVEEVQDELEAFLAENFPDLVPGHSWRRRPR